MTAPRFPGIAVSLGDSFSVPPSMEAMAAGSTGALRSGYFERMYLFDSNGRRWRVIKAEPTAARPKGPFGRLIGVHLTLGEPDQPSIGEVAEDLCTLVDSDPDDLYDQFVTREELKNLFRASRSAEELIAAANTLGAPA